MQEIIETKVIGYRANDGKVFETEKNCLDYERRKELTSKYDKLEKKEIFLPLVDFQDECQITLVKLKNEEDFEILKKYYDWLNGDYSDNFLNEYENLKFPCIKAIYDCNNYTELCYDGHKRTDIEMLIDELSKAITEINDFQKA